MNTTFIHDIYNHVEAMTGLTISDIRTGTSPADWHLAAAIGRADAAVAKIASGRVHPASPVGLRYAHDHTELVAAEVDRWITATLDNKGFGPASARPHSAPPDAGGAPPCPTPSVRGAVHTTPSEMEVSTDGLDEQRPGPASPPQLARAARRRTTAGPRCLPCVRQARRRPG